MGKRQTLAELVAPFRERQREFVFAAALISERAEARKLLAATGVYPLPFWRCPPTKKPTDEKILWLWIWSGYSGGPQRPTFLAGLAAAAGISAEAAYRVWPALMTSRTLFPDGTLSEAARQMLSIPIPRGQGRPTKGSEHVPAMKMPKTTATEPKKDEGTNGNE
jgi:hypothetical protein